MKDPKSTVSESALIDRQIAELGDFDAKAFKALVRAAIDLNTSGGKARR